jgi:hypothetical protein
VEEHYGYLSIVPVSDVLTAFEDSAVVFIKVSEESFKIMAVGVEDEEGLYYGINTLFNEKGLLIIHITHKHNVLLVQTITHDTFLFYRTLKSHDSPAERFFLYQILRCYDKTYMMIIYVK